ncbi:hypothetical protein ABID26_000629 [Mesorhizobium shonense]|uniref:Uncharacterized protein n=1 Tax=Mesorhizobium shonense TaxID=1209948 RepID=A0ABV2HL04_9HYPH
MKATVALLVGPQRNRAANDVIGGHEAEVATVEAVSDLTVHQEDSAWRDALAALPARQVTPASIAHKCCADFSAID